MARPKQSIEARILRALSGGKPVTRKALGQRLQLWPRARLDEALAPLLAGGQIVQDTRQGRKGRAARVYELAGGAP